MYIFEKNSDHRRGRSKNTGNLTVFYRKFRIFTVLTFLEVKTNARIVFFVRKYVGIVVFKKILRRKILADFWQMAISGKNPKIRILRKKFLSSKCFVLQLFWRIFGRGTRFWHYFWPPKKLKRSKSGITVLLPLISRSNLAPAFFVIRIFFPNFADLEMRFENTFKNGRFFWVPHHSHFRLPPP